MSDAVLIMTGPKKVLKEISLKSVLKGGYRFFHLTFFKTIFLCVQIFRSKFVLRKTMGMKSKDDDADNNDN